MSQTVALKTQPRTSHGSSAAARLRKTGMVPAVVYGHKQATTSVSVPREDFERAITAGNRSFELQAEGGSETAIIRDLQWDHLGKDILHVDFLRVDPNERIVVMVKVELRGVAPGASAEAVVDHELHDIHVECTPINRPDRIRVDLAPLTAVGQAIHVSDLKLPEGITAKDPGNLIVVQLKRPDLEPEVAVLGGAGPEVAVKGKGEKEGAAAAAPAKGAAPAKAATPAKK